MPVILLPPTGEFNLDPKVSAGTLIWLSSGLVMATLLVSLCRFLALRRMRGPAQNARQKAIDWLYNIAVLISLVAFGNTIPTFVAEITMGSTRASLTAAPTEKLIWSTTLLYNITLYVTKAMFIAFYMECYKNSQLLWVHRSLWSSLVAVVVLFLISTCVIVFSCWSMSYSWNPLADINHGCAIITTAGIVHILGTANIVADIAVTCTCIRMLPWMYRKLPRRTFIGTLLCLFIFGSSGLVAIIRLVILENIYENKYDAIWKGWHAMVMLTQLEVFIAMLGFCLMDLVAVLKDYSAEVREARKRSNQGVELADLAGSQRSSAPLW